MKINIGSTNTTKLEGVKQALSLFPEKFADAEIEGVQIQVEEFGHPKSFAETINGAKARAKAAFSDCDLSIGIEGGMMEAPLTNTGYVEFTACAIYDGKDFFFGFGSGFEWPKNVLEFILQGQDGGQAFRSAGLTQDDKKLGAQPGGNVGLLTQGRWTRETQVRESMMGALVEFLNPEYYIDRNKN